jgi:hypothetical protein
VERFIRDRRAPRNLASASDEGHFMIDPFEVKLIGGMSRSRICRFTGSQFNLADVRDRRRACTGINSQRV